MKVLAIIPARSGSKGIHLKNIKKLNGIPLIVFTINAAKNSKFINKIAVSTDSKKIAEIAEKNGIQVPILRPKSISGSNAKIEDAIEHTLNFYKNSYSPDIIVLLQPTSPLRELNNIDKGINLMIKEGWTTVIEVTKNKNHPEKSFTKSMNYLIPFKKNSIQSKNRQELEDIMYPTGSFFIFKRTYFEKTKSIFSKKIGYIETKKHIIDIDEMFDFFIAEMTIKYWEKFRNRNS